MNMINFISLAQLTSIVKDFNFELTTNCTAPCYEFIRVSEKYNYMLFYDFSTGNIKLYRDTSPQAFSVIWYYLRPQSIEDLKVLLNMTVFVS